MENIPPIYYTPPFTTPPIYYPLVYPQFYYTSKITTPIYFPEHSQDVLVELYVLAMAPRGVAMRNTPVHLTQE